LKIAFFYIDGGTSSPPSRFFASNSEAHEIELLRSPTASYCPRNSDYRPQSALGSLTTQNQTAPTPDVFIIFLE